MSYNKKWWEQRGVAIRALDRFVRFRGSYEASNPSFLKIKKICKWTYMYGNDVNLILSSSVLGPTLYPTFLPRYHVSVPSMAYYVCSLSFCKHTNKEMYLSHFLMVRIPLMSIIPPRSHLIVLSIAYFVCSLLPVYIDLNWCLSLSSLCKCHGGSDTNLQCRFT